MGSPTEAKNVGFRGMAGIGRVRFYGDIPHGNGTRQIAIDGLAEPGAGVLKAFWSP